ncbi:MAG: VWA domain-containing protein [Sandaracinaceae bacterium]|nr:VWA domain-containing protein [Sandaracinaceae bacterium]
MREDGGPILPPADLEVVLPYGESARVTLEAQSDLALLDVHFSIDTTGSFRDEIETLKRDLTASIVPALRRRVDDVAVGVSRMEDFPRLPFGESSDRPFKLVTAITTSLARVDSAVASLDMPLGSGGDGPEAGAEALYQIATGEGFSGALISPWSGVPASGGGTRAGVGFRDGALAVVVHVTDAPTHTPEDYAGSYIGTHSLTNAIDALRAEGIYVVGIASGDDGRGYLEEVAIGTGAVQDPVDDACGTGIGGRARLPVSGVCPLVFDVAGDGTGLSSSLVDAIIRLLDTVRIHEAFGVATDDPFHFVTTVEAVSATPPSGFDAPERADRRPSDDGILDTFTEVPTGTAMHFDALLTNSLIEPTDYDQSFRITVTIRGDALTLARRVIRVRVPAVHASIDASLDASQLDAGLADAANGDL